MRPHYNEYKSNISYSPEKSSISPLYVMHINHKINEMHKIQIFLIEYYVMELFCASLLTNYNYTHLIYNAENSIANFNIT